MTPRADGAVATLAHDPASSGSTSPAPGFGPDALALESLLESQAMLRRIERALVDGGTANGPGGPPAGGRPSGGPYPNAPETRAYRALELVQEIESALDGGDDEGARRLGDALRRELLHLAALRG